MHSDSQPYGLCSWTGIEWHQMSPQSSDAHATFKIPWPAYCQCHSSIVDGVDAQFRKSLRPEDRMTPLKTREVWRRPSWQGKARGKPRSIEQPFRFVSHR